MTMGWKPIVAIMAFLILAACQRAVPQVMDPALNETNSAQIFLYRSKQFFHSGNPEQPYFYVNDEQIGSMGTGDILSRRVPVGTYRISVRKPILFMPTYEAGSIMLTAEAGKTYYVRYSLDPGMLIGTNFTTSSSFAIVDEGYYQQRR